MDEETRCAHYQGERDIIVIKFKCCGKWFPCHKCHAELADHAAEVWPKNQFDARAVLCGGCGHQLTVREYLDCGSVCPRCRHQFNPGCANHYRFYFEGFSEAEDPPAEILSVLNVRR
ncbi:MAG: CHY zinc finger protein [Chthoniobacterales bacterium]